MTERRKIILKEPRQNFLHIQRQMKLLIFVDCQTKTVSSMITKDPANNRFGTF